MPCSFSYLLSITSVFRHHLSQRLQNFDAQPLLVFLQQLLRMFDQPAHMDISSEANTHSATHSEMIYSRCLLANETSALTLLARVCVFGEEQLWPMQHVHQNGQFCLDQGTETVLQSGHYVLEPGQRHEDC